MINSNGFGDCVNTTVIINRCIAPFIWTESYFSERQRFSFLSGCGQLVALTRLQNSLYIQSRDSLSAMLKGMDAEVISMGRDVGARVMMGM